MQKCYRIGELARRCGVSSRTIDYYTHIGLLQPVERTNGNYRIYGADAPTRIAHIRALQAQRFSLSEIVDRLDRDTASAESDVVERLRRATGELDRLHAELAELTPRARRFLRRDLTHASANESRGGARGGDRKAMNPNQRSELPAIQQVARDALLCSRGLVALLDSLVVGDSG